MPDAPSIASITNRLRNESQRLNRPFQEIVELYGFSGFLRRLSLSAHNQSFVLKGAQVFAAWGIPLGRPTRDLDFRGYTNNSIEELQQIIQDICQIPVDPPDRLLFDTHNIRSERITMDMDYPGIQTKFQARLGNIRIPLKIEVGFNDLITPPTIWVNYPSFLGLPQPRLRAYPPEAVLAEKVETLVKKGETNSRLKDFYDLYVLSKIFDFEGAVVQQSIKVTFHQRGTSVPSDTPSGLSAGFAFRNQASWEKRLQEYGANEPKDLQQVIQVLRGFLLPVLQAASQGEPFTQYWHAGGPWEKN